MRIKKSFVLFITINLFASSVKAADMLLEMGLHYGGDTIITVDENDGSRESLKAGEGFSIAAGMGFDINPDMQFNLSFGVKREVVYPAEGTITFVRYPLDMLFMQKKGNWRYGGGITAHMNPVYKSESLAGDETVEFKNAYGLLFDVRYFILQEIFVAGRVTWIKYKLENDPTNTSYDGSSIGVLAGFRF